MHFNSSNGSNINNAEANKFHLIKAMFSLIGTGLSCQSAPPFESTVSLWATGGRRYHLLGSDAAIGFDCCFTVLMVVS